MKNERQGVENLYTGAIYEGIIGALERGEFELLYQPQINTRFGTLAGIEALLRWRHPEKGFIGPLSFLPMIEKTDQMIRVGEWVLQAVCKQGKIWQDMGYLDVPIAINVSAHHIENGKIVETVRRALCDSGLTPGYLELEITEGVAIQDFVAVADILQRLRDLGVEIVIDDFGIEYASLKYIKSLPVDIVKIDKCFIDGIGWNHKAEVIIRNILSLLRSLDIEVIAEGVETVDQLRFLSDEGCWIVQGYYFYAPMPTSDIEKILRLAGNVNS
jgi:EAL domain-containing protein (putative c-di-GMP-specific phosphodiesterase class I)